MNGIYLLRSKLDVAFDDNGHPVNPLMVQLTVYVEGVMKLFNRSGWQASPESDVSLPHQYSLMARQRASGKGLVADLRQIDFSQTGHFHYGIVIESVVQHGARDIQSDLLCVFVDHCIDVTFSKASGESPKP